MANKENIVVNQDQLVEQLSHFLGEITVEGIPTTGSLSETTILRKNNGERFVVQKHINRDDESVLAEQRFLDYLRAKSFPGVRAIELGYLPFFRIDDDIYSIFPFIEGEGLDINNSLHCTQAFQAIGKFLSLSSKYNQETGIWENRWWNVMVYPFERNFREYIEESVDAESVMEIYQTSRSGLFAQLIVPARKGLYKTGIIHSDFRPEHFIFYGNTLRGIIDWTSAHYDVLVMEFARPFLYLCKSYEQRVALLEVVSKHIRFSREEEMAAFCSPLLLELTEFVWIVRHKMALGDEEFKKELSNAVARVSAAYRIYTEKLTN
jgi:hypothetical protein